MFEGKTVVITGGSRGIGRAAAELFAREGGSLALCARNEHVLQQAAKALSTTHGDRIFACCADILDTQSVQTFIDHVAERFGRIDVLVNNAGESSQREANGVNWPVNAVDSIAQVSARGRFESISDDEWRRALEQKLLGMIRVIRHALPLMRQAGNGSIVNVTSIKGIQPPPRVVTSGVAWAAAMNFSKALSFELASDRIRVNVVSVGGIQTEQMEAGRQKWAPQKTLEGFLAPPVQNIPLKRLGLADDVAQTILYLASSASSYVTGRCIAVDGGGTRAI
jgi:3-oxoacyl-[acyl-carrier protein] reductase